MTDRYSGFAVTLDADIREDDARHIINAIRMIKGVAIVEPVIASPSAASIAASREALRWFYAMRDAIESTANPKDNARG